jgi:hypothetical protein
MALIPTLVRDTTISDTKAVFYNQTVYTDTERSADYASYLFLVQKKLDGNIETVEAAVSEGALEWSVELAEDSHYQASLVLVPNYTFIKAQTIPQVLTTKTILFHEGKLYRPIEALDLSLEADANPTTAAHLYTEVMPTLKEIGTVDTTVPVEQRLVSSVPFDFLWYINLTLKYAQHIRQAYKECTTCDDSVTRKTMELFAVVLKVNTAESLKDWRGGQLIIESEEQLIKSCSC